MSSQYARQDLLGLLMVALLVAGLSACGPQRPSSQETDARQKTRGSAMPRTSEGVRVTVPQGTEVRIALFTAVGSMTSRVGDILTARTTAPVVVGDRVPIPTGSTIHGHVTGVSPVKNGLRIAEKGGAVTLSFDRVTTAPGLSAPMSASLASIARAAGKTRGIIGGSAAAGTKGKELVIHAGTHLAITLDQPLTITDRT